MNRFSLLALIEGLLSPIAANVESWYFLAAGKGGDSNKEALTSWTVPMASEKLCEAAGQKLIDDKGWFENRFVLKAGTRDKDPALHYTCVRSQ